MNATLTRRAPLATKTLMLALLAALAFLSAAPAHAQGYTLTKLHSFSVPDSDGRNPDGAYPGAGVTSDGMGHLYGTARYGGTYGFGTLFEYDLTTQTFTTLVNFDITTGYYPISSVALDGQGRLYGTTGIGGSNGGKGTLFVYDLVSGTLTTLVHFNGSNGTEPTGHVTLDGQRHLYGTTYEGGSHGYGTLYKYNLMSGVLTTLVNFNNDTHGALPQAGIVLDGQGFLYGTNSGGNHHDGTVFKFNLTTHVLTTLVTFNGNNGMYPYGGVTWDGQGHLYGTTYQGGSSSYGTVFKVNLSTHALTTLATFTGSNGVNPDGGVALDGRGHLYGTTSSGGSHGNGTVFKVNLATKVLTTLANFPGTNHGGPIGNIALDDNGALYGTTFAGGAYDNGRVYELTPNP